MALIGRLGVILIGLVAAGLIGGGTVVAALLLPEFSDRGISLDKDTVDALLGPGLIFASVLALLPAVVIVTIAEAFNIRSALAYCVSGVIVGLLCFVPLVFFEGIVGRHIAIMTGAGIVAGVVYWMIAGRNAGAWRIPPMRLNPPPLSSASRPD